MRKWLGLACAVMSLNQFSWAVGGAAYSNQVVGSRAYGMGLAFAGLADDPSAVYFNPAGLTQLKRAAISYGFTIEPIDSDYSAKSANQITGGSADGTEGSMDSFMPVVPHFYATVPFKEKWVLGFGINSPFGLETQWSNNGPLRYAATDSKVAYLNFNPTVAYQVNEQFSVGAGIVYGLNPSSKLKKKINNNVLNYNLTNNPAFLIAGLPDGEQNLEGDGDGWGYNAAVHYKPSEKHGFGISYRSRIDIDVEGKVDLTNLSGAAATHSSAFGGSSYSSNVTTELKQPRSVILGYGYKPGKWTFALDGEWIEFSSIDRTSLKFSGSSASGDAILNSPSISVIQRDWRNTWNLGLGANYQFNEKWEGRFGYFHHPSVIPNDNWDPSIPDSSKNGYTIGGSFNLTNFSIDAVYNLVEFHKRTVNNSNSATLSGTANGTYETTANIFSVTMNHRFGGN